MIKFFKHVRFEENSLASNNSDGLKVIGAGLPRTGTLSLKKALTQLCSAKCYHMAEVLGGDQEDLDVWFKAVDGQMGEKQWREYFTRKNFVSTVDFPAALFYKELMAAFPEAKVILSTRNSKSWYTSCYNTVYKLTTLICSWPTRILIDALDEKKNTRKFHETLKFKVPKGCSMSMGEAIESGPEAAEQFFLQWEQEVIRSVPPDRLLVHYSMDGWEPLCSFLGLPVPNNPYPRVNDTASIQRGTRNLKILSAVIFYFVPFLLSSFGFYFGGQIF